MSVRLKPSMLTNRIAPRYEEALRVLDLEGRWNAPYQFAIPVMAAMWFDLQQNWINENAADWKLMFTKDGAPRTVLELEKYYYKNDGVEEFVLPWGNLDPVLKRKGPDKVTHALDCPIRAIAFFSWEESGRVFLARRVYPTFFNFLSYSHCPEGWGALGRMINELKEKKSEYFTSGYYGITCISEFSQSALPFLSEVERLNYKSIFVIPIVEKWGMFKTTHDLKGGFVVFVDKPSLLPRRPQSKKDPFTKWLKATNEQVVSILRAQDKLFGRPALESIWRRKARTLGKRSSERGIFELKITEGKYVRERIDLKLVVSNLIASLSTSEFHAILDSKMSKRHTAVVLIAKTELLPRIERVKTAILRAVGTACQQKPDKFNVWLRKL